MATGRQGDRAAGRQGGRAVGGEGEEGTDEGGASCKVGIQAGVTCMRSPRELSQLQVSCSLVCSRCVTVVSRNITASVRRGLPKMAQKFSLLARSRCALWRALHLPYCTPRIVIARAMAS